MAKIKLVEKVASKCEAFAPKTVRIDGQVWMAENLDVDDGGEGIYFNEKNGEHYYSWYAARRIAKSIPGWHLPTDEEWVEAAKACGATPASDGDYDGVTKLKSKLNIKLAGAQNFGIFSIVGRFANFWTATEDSSDYAYSRSFSTGEWMPSNYDDKTGNAFSVRLVKD